MLRGAEPDVCPLHVWTGQCLVGQFLCSVNLYSRHSRSLICVSDTLCTLGDADPDVCDTTRLHNRPYQLITVLKQYATNAVSERSASVLRRVKTYLRSTVTQLRLNNLLTLHGHKDKTDDLCIPE